MVQMNNWHCAIIFMANIQKMSTPPQNKREQCPSNHGCLFPCPQMQWGKGFKLHRSSYLHVYKGKQLVSSLTLHLFTIAFFPFKAHGFPCSSNCGAPTHTLPVGGVFIPPGCSVCKTHTRHGGSERSCQYSALRGGEKAGMGSERRLCVRECRRGGMEV